MRDLLRRKGMPYEELGLDDPALSDDQLIDAIMAHPILINRPIVVTPFGVKLCHPWKLCRPTALSAMTILAEAAGFWSERMGHGELFKDEMDPLMKMDGID